MAPVERGTIDPHLYAGPGFGVLVSSDLSTAYDDVEVSADIKDQMKSFDAGLIGGAGLDYPMASGTLSFEARYEVGFGGPTDLDNSLLGMLGFVDQPDVKNSVVSFMVGYGFAF